MNYTCLECIKWRAAEKATFEGERAAIEHAVHYHPHRVVESLMATPRGAQFSHEYFLASVLYDRSA